MATAAPRRPALLVDRAAFRLLLGALLAVVLTVATVPALNLTAYSPQRSVLSYLAALEDGDASRALGLLAAPPTRNTEALHDEVLAGAWSLPSRAEVIGAATDGDRAEVAVRFDLGDTSHEQTYTLVRGAPRWGLFDRWLLEVEKWPRLGLDVSGSSVAEVNGVSAPTDRGGIPVLFPVGYTVGFDAEYLRADPVLVDVIAPGQIATAALDPQPTAALLSEVEDRVAAQIDACEEQRTLLPAGCPFGFETDHEILGDVTWRIVEQPPVTLTSSGTHLTIAPGEAVVEVSGRSRDIVTAFESDFTERIIVQVVGTVTVDGGEIEVDLANEGQSLGESAE